MLFLFRHYKFDFDSKPVDKPVFRLVDYFDGFVT